MVRPPCVSQYVWRVGVASWRWGTRAARIRSWSVTAVRRTASPRATSNRTTTRRTTSTRTISRLEIVERVLGERSLGEQLLTNSLTRRTTSRRTTSHKRLARTAKTNLEPLVSECLLLHLCVLARAHHRKGSLHRLCGEGVTVLLHVIDTLQLSGLVYPQQIERKVNTDATSPYIFTHSRKAYRSGLLSRRDI